MATRPDQDLKNATIVVRTVVTAAVILGGGVKDGSNDHECQPLAASTDLPLGVVVALGGNPNASAPGAVGDRVSIALCNGGGVVKCKSGGTCTRGTPAKYADTGGKLANAALVAAATGTACWVLGYFTQSGVDEDEVGLALGRHWGTEA